MLNLLSNAVRHTPSGTITIKLRLLDESPDKVRIEFSVTDTGSGIPESRLKTIFSTPSVNTGTPNLYAGTGLGLSIVKHLVEGQGGSVSVSSEVGKGSSFCFVLDFLKADEKIEAEMEMTEHLPGDLSEIRVLVAEDVALNQLLMKTLLTGWGFSFEIVDNGKMAIEKMRTGKFDIVLMDIQMPEMNGFEATRSIRTELRSDIPIIALTADVTDSDLNRCRAVGMNDYMAKPVDDKLLYRKIISLVNARRRKAVQLSWNGASMTGPTAQQQGK
jgi:CheY-like chemotaxis protein